MDDIHGAPTIQGLEWMIRGPRWAHKGGLTGLIYCRHSAGDYIDILITTIIKKIIK